MDFFVEDRLEELDQENQSFSAAVTAALEKLNILSAEDLDNVKKATKPSLTTRQNKQRETLRNLFQSRPLVLMTTLDAFQNRERAASRAAEQRFEAEQAMRQAWNIQTLGRHGMQGIAGVPNTSREFYVPSESVKYLNRAAHAIDPLSHCVQPEPLEYEGDVSLSDYTEFLHFRSNKKINWNSTFMALLPETFRLGMVDKHYHSLFRKLALKYSPEIYPTIEFETDVNVVFESLITLETDADVKLQLTLQLQQITRRPADPIKSILELYRSLRYQIEILDKPNQAISISKQNSERAAKQAAPHFVSATLKKNLVRWVEARNSRLTDTSLTDIIKYITKAEQREPGLRLENDAKLSPNFVQLSCNSMVTRSTRRGQRSPSPHLELGKGERPREADWANRRRNDQRGQSWGGQRGGSGARPGNSRRLSASLQSRTPSLESRRSQSPWGGRSRSQSGSRPGSRPASRPSRPTSRPTSRPRSRPPTPGRSPLPAALRSRTPSLDRRYQSDRSSRGASRSGTSTGRTAHPRTGRTPPPAVQAPHQPREYREQHNGHTAQEQRSRHPPQSQSGSGAGQDRRGRSPNRQGGGGGGGRPPYRQGRSPTVPGYRCLLCMSSAHGHDCCPIYRMSDFSRYVCSRCWAGRHKVQSCKGRVRNRPDWAQPAPQGN